MGILGLQGGLRLKQIGQKNTHAKENKVKNTSKLSRSCQTNVIVYGPFLALGSMWTLQITEGITVGIYYRLISLSIGLTVVATTALAARNRSRALRIIRAAMSGDNTSGGAKDQLTAEHMRRKRGVRMITLGSNATKLAGMCMLFMCGYGTFAPEMVNGDRLLTFLVLRFCLIDLIPSAQLFNLLRMIKWHELDTYRTEFRTQMLSMPCESTIGGMSHIATSIQSEF
jgi:hypothetical protein